MMGSEVVGVASVEAFVMVPDIFRMVRSVWVLLDSEVSISGEEVTIDGAALAFGLLVEVHVLVLHHASIDGGAGLDNHSCLGLKVRSVVPWVGVSDVIITHAFGENEAEGDGTDERVVSETETGDSARLGVREIMHPSVERRKGDATS